MYNEQYGPTLSETDHAANYLLLEQHYKLGPECTGDVDYFLVGTVEGVEYYAPNNEDWGTIVAVHRGCALACDSTFYDLHDVKGSPEDYALYPSGEGRLVPGFEVTRSS